MYRRLICASALVLAMSLVSQAPAKDPDVLIRNPDAAMPVIDGVVDDGWSLSTEQTISTTVAGSSPSSPADCSGTWRALWDYDHLYGLVVVKDEALNNDSGAGSKWNDDSVEFYVDGDNSKGSTCDRNDHQYTFRWNNAQVEEPSAYHNGAPSIVGIQYAIATTSTGYIFEVRIPWTSIMGTGPTPGQLIGIEVFINDDDNGSDRDSQIAWFGTDGNGWQTPSMWGTGLLVAGNIAGKPNPPDGSIHPETWASLSWLAGPTAVSHDVYFSDNFIDVNEGTHASAAFRGNQAGTYFVVGFPGFPYPDGLVPGTTYYWRIDEINAEGKVFKGNVWRFSIPPRKAYNPVPADGAESVDVKTKLSWTPGFGAKLHTVYFGDNSDTVANAVSGTASGVASYDPGTLKWAKTYYWRVDEFDGSATYKGDVWSFTTLGAVGNPNPANGAVNVKQTPVLTWTPGAYAASHEVYFGTTAEAVRNATKTSPEFKATKTRGDESYAPGKLAWEATYYWRIDEVNNVNPDSPWVGKVWSFTTADYAVVDDFESYNAGDNQIWYAWHDGLGYGTPGTPPYFAGNGSGAAVGDETTASFTEETIVHGGRKSMPLAYDNNKQGFAKYSEAELTLTDLRDWTEEGVGELSIWFRGRPGAVGSFVETPAGTYTMTGSGTDIWDIGTAGNYHDEFHFAYKTLTGAGSIIARVQSVQNTNGWAKAGVMIRETLDGGSKHAFAAITPSNGVASQGRLDTGGASFNANQTGVTAPRWLKLERDLSGNFTVNHSANGTTWQPVTGATPQNIQMGSTVYIGLAVTAHNAAATCQAVFTNVTTTGTVSPQWAHQDIGIASNAAEPLYVAVSNSGGAPAVIVHPDPAAAQITDWTEWVVPLSAFADKGINLKNVDKLALGLGTRGNMTAPGGSGKMYFDDIRLNRPRPAP